MILQTNFVKYLGTTIDNTLSQKQNIDTITPKLNNACYIIRRSKLYLSNDALKVVYYAFFHSVVSYGLIFGEIQLRVSVYLNYGKELLE